MAGPTYSTDLVTIDAAGAGTTWTELGTWSAASTITQGETDYFIQGSNCVSCAVKTGLGGLVHPAVSAQTFPTDGAVLVWMKWDAPNSLEPASNGGIRTTIGSSNNAFWGYNQGGKDTYTYGGWINLATGSPAAVANDYAVGSPTTSYTNFSWAYNAPVAVPSKGNPYGVDAVRIGRCQLLTVNGDGTEYGGFANMAANNDAQANRWGLFQAIAGGYLWKGLMSLGNTTNYVDFRDSNKAITVQNTPKVTSNFNKIEISNTSSNVFWTAISISSLSTVSPGNFACVDDANVQFSSCTFNNMGTFAFKPKANVVSCTFNGCGQITLSNSHFTNCRVSGSTVATNTSALVWDNDLNTSGFLDGTTFVRGTTNNHAIEFGTNSPTAIELVNVAFTGYNAGNNLNDSAIVVKRTSGTVTITITGGSTPSYSNSAGAAVEFVTSSVNATVYTKDIDGNNVDGARVLLKASAGPMAFDATVTITNSGTTANVAHTSHGLLTNDKVLINGASHWQNNGVFTITKINDNAYNYTLPSAPGSDPTGTIKATYVALEGLTSSGVITMSRAFGADQPVNGWARKSSAQPYYKPAPLTGTIDSATGFAATAVMISDE